MKTVGTIFLVLMLSCGTEQEKNVGTELTSDTTTNPFETTELSSISTSEKFEWSIQILDRWITENATTCDACETSTSTIVAMSDIFEALEFLEKLTGIKSNIKYNLGTSGIILIDGASYETDKQNWKKWFVENNPN